MTKQRIKEMEALFTRLHAKLFPKAQHLDLTPARVANLIKHAREQAFSRYEEVVE